MDAAQANRIYALQPDGSGKVFLQQVWAQSGASGLGAGHTNLVAMQIANRVVLVAYDKATQTTTTYGLSGGDPWIAPLDNRIDLTGGPWDIVQTFVFGNDPYLMTYRADQGAFGFFKIASDLSASPPYTFQFPRNWPTKDFTTVAPFASLGAQYVLCYNFERGTVAIYSLATITSAPGGAPALLAQNTWYHTWARGWTHFAFFQLGGANFFFKINLAKLNVNIDHIQDNPAAGTVEVGSWLQSQLPDAEIINAAATVPWAHGEPYLLTYIASTGKTEVLHVHADCRGWTRVSTGSTVAGASRVLPYRIGDVSYALFYGGKDTPSSSLGVTTSESPASPVAPDSVRVWRGYALDRAQRDAFYQSLGSTFIPITAQVMGKLGLTAYLPAIVPGDRTPSVPDEIALVFYRTQADYQQSANGTTAGRAYQKLHAGVFSLGTPKPGQPTSASGFPILLKDACVSGQPYYLFPEAIDWYGGASEVFVGVFEGDGSQLAGSVLQAARTLQTNRVAGLDGCILVVVDNVLIYWRHWQSATSQQPWNIGLPLRTVLSTSARVVDVNPSEYARYDGLAAQPGQYLNVHFGRT